MHFTQLITDKNARVKNMLLTANSITNTNTIKQHAKAISLTMPEPK